jgi:hypothetical protein
MSTDGATRRARSAVCVALSALAVALAVRLAVRLVSGWRAA